MIIIEQPSHDVSLEGLAGQSLLGGVDRASGFILLAIAGLDLCVWLVRGNPPQPTIVVVPAIALNLYRRALTGESRPRWPVSWCRAMAAYTVAILAVVLIKGVTSWRDWVICGSAASFAGLWSWKAIRR